MPELPEVETIVKGLKKTLIGQKVGEIHLFEPQIIKSSPELFKRILPGSLFENIRRIGKMILISLSSSSAHNFQILIHLKMTGQLLLTLTTQPINKHTHLVIELLPSKKHLIYRDVRRFGYFYLGSHGELRSLPLVENLGPDALTLTWSSFHQIMANSKGKLKNLLLNQSLISGIGNIYADEILFNTGIHPEQRAERLNVIEQKKLHRSIQSILKKAAKYGGSSIRDFLDSDGQPGNFQLLHKVYGREGKTCKVCGNNIQRIKLTSRSSYFCPNCQKIHP